METIWEQLKKGTLPGMEVSVTLKQEALINLFAGIFFTVIAIVIATKLIKSI